MITIVDYGLGNVQAFTNVFKRLNIPVSTARTAVQLGQASRIILPGVGAFDHAMSLLEASGMRPVLDDLVLRRNVPVIGICVGMQMLADGSDEGHLPGLGWIPGRVRSMRALPSVQALPMPHMGWNDVAPTAPGGLFSGLETGARFYFLHSYYFECRDMVDRAAMVSYGVEFACAVRRNHVHGVQFHPEKSHHWGETLLKNFADQQLAG